MATTNIESDKYKELGNSAFKAGDFTTAIQHYSTAISLIISTQTNTSILPSLYSNRSLCYLKQNNIHETFYDCYQGLQGLESSHPMYLKLAVRYSTTSLSLSTDSTISTKLGINGETYPQRTTEDLIKEATVIMGKVLQHPDLLTTAGMAQQVSESINQHSLPLTPPKVPIATKKTISTSSSKPIPATAIKTGNIDTKITMSQGVNIDNMTLADLQRLNQQSQPNIPPDQSKSNMPPQPIKKLQGVWAQGGGKSLADMLKADIKTNGGPIVIKSKDSFISAIQQSKLEPVVQTPVSLSGTMNANTGMDDNSMKNDNSTIFSQSTTVDIIPTPYIPPHSRRYTSTQLQTFVQFYNQSSSVSAYKVQNLQKNSQNPQQITENTESDLINLDDDDDDDDDDEPCPIGYFGTSIDPAVLQTGQQNGENTANCIKNGENTAKCIKKQWRNASMVPRSTTLLLSDFDTASEGEHDDSDNDDDKDDEKKKKNNENDENDEIDKSTNQIYENPIQSINETEITDQSSSKRRNILDFNRFDDIPDENSDEEWQKELQIREKIRLNKQRHTLAQKHRENKHLKLTETLNLYQINAKQGHIHDGCLAPIKPQRLDDRVNVVCWNEFGLLMLGTVLPDDQIQTKTEQTGSASTDDGIPTSVDDEDDCSDASPFILGGQDDDQKVQDDLENCDKKDDDQKVQDDIENSDKNDEDDRKSDKTDKKLDINNKNDEKSCCQVDRRVISKDIYSKYTWSLPHSNASTLISSTTQQHNIHPSHTDLAVVSVLNTVKYSPEIQKRIKKMKILNNLGVYEVPSLQYPRRLTTIINAQIELDGYCDLDMEIQEGDCLKQSKESQEVEKPFYWFSNTEVKQNNDNISSIITSTTQIPQYCVAFIPFDVLLQDPCELELTNYQIVNIIESLATSIVNRVNNKEKNGNGSNGTANLQFSYPSKSKQIANAHRQHRISVKDGTKAFRTPKEMPVIGLSVGDVTILGQDFIKQQLAENIDGQNFEIENLSSTKKALNCDNDVSKLKKNKHFPFSTVEPILLSTAPNQPTEPAVLLVQRRVGGHNSEQNSHNSSQSYVWGLPITHIDDADSIGFTSTRLIHSIFGSLVEKWSLIDIISSETFSTLPFSLPFEKTKIQFDQYNTSIMTDSTAICTIEGQNGDKIEQFSKLSFPIDIEDDYTYYKGFRAVTFAHIYGKTHSSTSFTATHHAGTDGNEINVVSENALGNSNTPATITQQLATLSPYWPSRTKPSLVNYKWVTRGELDTMTKNDPKNSKNTENNDNSIDNATFLLLQNIFNRFTMNSSILQPLIQFEWDKPNLSPAQQHEVQRINEEENTIIHSPFGFGSLLSVETMNKSR